MHVIINLLPVKGMPMRRALGASGIRSVPDEAGNPARLSVVVQIVVKFPFSIFSQAMSSPCMSPCRPCMSSPSRSFRLSLSRSLSALSSLVLSQMIMASRTFSGRPLFITVLHKALRFESAPRAAMPSGVWKQWCMNRERETTYGFITRDGGRDLLCYIKEL